MHIASGHEVLRVPSLHAPLPQGRPGWLRWNGLGNVRILQVLVVNGKSQNSRELPRSLRMVNINAYMDSITHGNHEISVLYHFFIGRLGSLRVGRSHFLTHSFLLILGLGLTFPGSSVLFNGSGFKEGGLLPREDGIEKRGLMPPFPMNS
jgi:hypothetical protein